MEMFVILATWGVEAIKFHLRQFATMGRMNSLRQVGQARKGSSNFAASKLSILAYMEALGSPTASNCGAKAAGMVPQLARVAHPYGVTVNSGGGFDSVSVKHEFAKKVLARDCPTIVLQVGDLDASGISILDSFAADVTAFCEHYEPKREDVVDFRRVLVRPEQEAEYGLVREDKPETDKTPGCSVCKRTGKRYNPPLNYQIQAEAFAPDVLADIVRDAIESVIDLDELAVTKAESAVIRDELVEWIDGKGD